MKLVKLLLQEVEVTISLSSSEDNRNSVTKHKVISLRDLSEFRQQQYNLYQEEMETEAWDIEKQLTHQRNEMETLERKKNKLLQDIKDSINKEKEAWQITKEEERKQAQNVGYKTGYDAGLEQAQKEYESLLEEVNKITKLAKDDYIKTVAKHEKAIIQLAITTAEKITKQHIAHSEDGMLEIIKHALEDLKDRSNISIYVEPADYEFVSKRKEELEELLEADELISIYADQHLNQGDCVIKHPFGQLEVGIDVQLKQIKTALEEIVLENQ